MSAGFIPGPYWAGKYSSMLGCPVMAQPDPAENSIVICSVYGGMADDDRARAAECEATARLLATAPELYDALRGLLAFCPAETDAQDRAVIAARIAIGKAKVTAA